MRKNATLRNLGIKNKTPNFWQRTGIVCCWVLMFMFLLTAAYAGSTGTSTIGSNSGSNLGVPPPCMRPDVSVSDLTVCDNEPAIIGQASTGDTAYITGYQWQISPDGVNWTNLVDGGGYYHTNLRALVIKTPSTSLSGAQYRVIDSFNTTYYCTATYTSNPMTLTVLPSPVIKITTDPSVICQGQTSTFCVKVTNACGNGCCAAGPFTYQWYDDPILPGETDKCLIVSNDHTYCVLVYDWYMCGAEACDNIIVNAPPTINTPPGACDVTLECTDQNGIAAALLCTPTATNTATCPMTTTLTDVTTPDPNCEFAYVRVRTWTFTNC